MVSTTVSLSEEHANFISSQTRQFNLSKFVRVKLDEYIIMKRRLIENGKTNEKTDEKID